MCNIWAIYYFVFLLSCEQLSTNEIMSLLKFKNRSAKAFA